MRPKSMRRGLIDLCSVIGWLDKIETILEIGSYAGESTAIFYEHLNLKEIICVDPWETGYDENDNGSLVGNVDVAESVFDETVKSFNCTKLKMKSDDVDLKSLPNIDFVYLDGLHTYEQLKKDIIHFLPLKPKMIAAHDYFWLDKLSGKRLNEAFIEVLEAPEFVFSDSSMLKIIGDCP